MPSLVRLLTIHPKNARESHVEGRKMKPRPRRLDSTTDRFMRRFFQPEHNVQREEEEYLEAAEDGDLATVTRIVRDHNININCHDRIGRTALELATQGNHETVVDFLLHRVNVASVEEALLCAIDRENVKLCELVLSHPLYKNSKIKLSGTDGFYNKDDESPKLRPAATPLVLAAQKNNFCIVQMLMELGAKIERPHDYFCDCTECSNQRVFDSVKYSKKRLSTYRALVSPAYISLSSEDPIFTAFHLSHELEQLTDIEKEYKSEYHRLSTMCKDYAVELLDLCRSSEEIVALLSEDDHHSNRDGDVYLQLNRVKLALKYDQKRFIAHATCQRQLITLWYSGLPWMRHQHVIIKLLAVPVATILLPISSLVFLAAPNSKIGVKIRSPFVKFLNHTCSYMVFLVLVFMATNRGGSGNPWLDMACHGMQKSLPDSIVVILIFIWVLGMFVHECRQLWREGPKNYITDWWNWMDSALIALYLASYALQLVIYIKVVNAPEQVLSEICPMDNKYTCREMLCEVKRSLKNWTKCESSRSCQGIDELWTPRSGGEYFDKISIQNQVADVFFALANVLSFARIAHLLPANEQLGPLLVSFGRMLQDVLRFGVVFMLVFLAFMCGLTSLYSVHQCENNYFSRMDLSLGTLFWATFGMGSTNGPVIDNRYLGSRKRLITTHSSHTAITTWVGYALFCSYIAGAVVVLLNMLIAMMSNSFQEIYDDRDVEWKFARAKLWIDFFEDGCTLPTPFNMIPNPKYLTRLFRWCRKRLSGTRDEPPVGMAYIYAKIVRRLVQRYICKKQCERSELQQKENELDDVQNGVQTLSDQVYKLRHEMFHLRRNMSPRQQNTYTGHHADTRSRIELQL